MDIYGYKASVYIPGKVVDGKFIVRGLFGKDFKDKLLELTVRVKVIDKGVNPALASSFLDSKEWKAFRGYFVNAKVGEVMNKAGKLLGSLKGTKIYLCNIYKKNDRPSRAGFVLESTGVKFADGETPDHIDSTQPLNDSISNLRPLDKSGQSNNRIFAQKSIYSVIYTGNLLPTHPTIRSIKLTDTGMVNVGQGWYKGSIDKDTGNYKVQIDGSHLQIHKVMVEAKLGRLLVESEDVDHISGVRTNALSNLRPILQFDNIMKSTIKLITRIDSKGTAVVFGSGIVAAEVTCVHSRSKIIDAIKSGKEYAGYTWKDAADAEIDQFFREMSFIDLAQDFSHLSSNPRYDNLLKSIKLYAEWKKALSS